MLNKELPFKYPVITSYPKHAQLLAGLLNYPEVDAWFYSNYIQLFAGKGFENEGDFFGGWFDFYTTHHLFFEVPIITKQRILRSILEHSSRNILDFVYEMINQEFYVWLYVDKYFIPNSTAFGKHFHPHSILIYGYKKEERLFKIAGFFNHNGFRELTVKEDDLKKAFFSRDLIDHFEKENYLEYVFLYKFNEKGKYSLDINCIRGLLSDYYHSQNTSEKFGMVRNPAEGTYGLNIYKRLQEFVKIGIEDRPLDVRPFHVLYDHKKCMNLRINYLHNLGYISKIDELSNLYLRVEQQALILRNHVLKYNCSTNNSILLNKINTMIDRISDLECNALEIFLSEIS